MIWKRLLALFIPSPGALTLLWAALGTVSLLSMTALVIALDDSLSLQSALAFINVLALPPGMLMNIRKSCFLCAFLLKNLVFLVFWFPGGQIFKQSLEPIALRLRTVSSAQGVTHNQPFFLPDFSTNSRTLSSGRASTVPRNPLVVSAMHSEL